MFGHCEERKGTNTNKGQKQLEGCFLTPEGCLGSCREYQGYTGCEYHSATKNCYVHTDHIVWVDNTYTKNICWLFTGEILIWGNLIYFWYSVDELPGKCSDNITQISGNFTSENCLKSCQEVLHAEGCQYDMVTKKCGYFTSPVLAADNQHNHICWNFNKGIKCQISL